MQQVFIGRAVAPASRFQTPTCIDPVSGCLRPPQQFVECTRHAIEGLHVETVHLRQAQLQASAQRVRCAIRSQQRVGTFARLQVPRACVLIVQIGRDTARRPANWWRDTTGGGPRTRCNGPRAAMDRDVRPSDVSCAVSPSVRERASCTRSVTAASSSALQVLAQVLNDCDGFNGRHPDGLMATVGAACRAGATCGASGFDINPDANGDSADMASSASCDTTLNVGLTPSLVSAVLAADCRERILPSLLKQRRAQTRSAPHARGRLVQHQQ